MTSQTFQLVSSASGTHDPVSENRRLKADIENVRLRTALQHQVRARQRMRTLETVDGSDWLSPYANYLDRIAGDPVYRAYGTGWSPSWSDRLYPIIRTENDLQIIRMPSRVTAWSNPYAVALRNTVCNYVVAEGFTYSADVSEDDSHPGLAEAYQRLIDEHLEYNGWGANGVGETEQIGIEREAVDRYIYDGEPIIRESRAVGGMTTVEFLDPGQLRRPPKGDAMTWSFGILHECGRPVAYNFQDGYGRDEVVEADDIIHVKNNVGRNIKRGMPDFSLGLQDTLRGANLIRANVAESSAQQSAIVAVEQSESGTAEDWSGEARNEASVSTNDPYNGQTRYYGLVEKGITKRVPAGFSYLPGPGASSSAGQHEIVIKLLLRVACARYGMPDWAITSDPSVANFATSLTVNSSWVQSVKGIQKLFRGPFSKSVQRAVEWRIRYLGRLPVKFTDPHTGQVIHGGYDWKEVLRVCRVKVTCPDPVSRDPLQLSQQREIELRNGIISRQLWAAETGRDMDSVMRENEEYQERFPDAGNNLAMPPGLDSGGPVS